MKQPAKTESPASTETNRQTLLTILEQLLDGVDGYESEHGDLRYWDPKAVAEARRLIASVPAER